jgi:DNA-binding FadR family transcriptional regulator
MNFAVLLMSRTSNLSEFLSYLVSLPYGNESSTQLPSLFTLSKQLNISVARLREQLEVARALGLVEVRPRTGIRRQAYSFLPSVRQSLDYALELDRGYFDDFAELRNHLEAAYWHKAVRLLTPDDHQELHRFLLSAWEKLRGPQIQIPHQEHRQLHMVIYGRLENPFVSGILEAYWDAYEAVGLNLYAGIEYLREVWGYHQRMVEAICAGDFDAGFQALVEHTDLLHHRPVTFSLSQDLRG